jgi:hypothetical protein
VRATDGTSRWSGAVTFIQRFGPALNLNVHFHTLALDGAYPYEVDHRGPRRFPPVPPPEPDEVGRLLAGAAPPPAGRGSWTRVGGAAR